MTTRYLATASEAWKQLFDAIAETIAAIQTTGPDRWTTICEGLAHVIDAADALTPPELQPQLDKLKAACPTAADPQARDWSGFFAAIVSLIKELAPVILPYIVANNTDETK
jgi:hypothetical protein